MTRYLHSVRNFGLYVNGLRTKEQGLNLEVNPENGRVRGRVFLIPQDSLFQFEEVTPTEDITVTMHSIEGTK